MTLINNTIQREPEEYKGTFKVNLICENREIKNAFYLANCETDSQLQIRLSTSKLILNHKTDCQFQNRFSTTKPILKSRTDFQPQNRFSN